ncbi:restriction endonuclease subunit S [Heyndrickxia coagulans]|uniref:restriction endonuclease subunit S n=1 Tax=Heyndrickxia coagulans TaxID=1398 RepID=UPI00037AECA8|nr:restriction endonuclease subunit S [Heyndrickxia coagulans]
MKYKIEELCEINSENISKSDDIKYIYYLDTSNLTRGTINEIQKLIVGKDKLPSRAKRKVKVNDILISTVRPNQRHYGIIRKEIENLIVSTGFAVLSPNLKKVNPEYLYWYLTQDSIVNYLQSIAETSTSAYPSIKPSVIGGLEIDLPKLEEQKAIANILSTLDEKIETNNQINEKLEEMAQALFKHWFVDFEFPNENGEPYKSSGGEMVESEVGMIPKGWKIVTLEDLTSKFTTGLNPRKNFVLGKGENYYVTIKNMGNNQIYLDDKCDKIDNDAIKKINKRSDLKKGDLLFSGIGTIGRVYLIDETPENWNISESIFTLRPSKLISSEILYLLLLSEQLQGYAQQLASGSVQKGVRMRDLKAYKLAIPSNCLIEKFTELIRPLIRKNKYLEKENKRLKAIRDTLLPRLLSGEIRVPLDDEVLSEQN